MPYETIKNFLAEGGKCLLIESGKPVGVVLTIEEYEKLLRLNLDRNLDRLNLNREKSAENQLGETIAKEANFEGLSASIDEINLADAESITLENLGLDELPY
ncbi:MAG: hypothetical protein AAB958_01290 [Patescibacteria group bacterium]